MYFILRGVQIAGFNYAKYQKNQNGISKGITKTKLQSTFSIIDKVNLIYASSQNVNKMLIKENKLDNRYRSTFQQKIRRFNWLIFRRNGKKTFIVSNKCFTELNM